RYVRLRSLHRFGADLLVERAGIGIRLSVELAEQTTAQLLVDFNRGLVLPRRDERAHQRLMQALPQRVHGSAPAQMARRGVRLSRLQSAGSECLQRLEVGLLARFALRLDPDFRDSLQQRAAIQYDRL